MRHNLSYRQASANSQRKADAAYAAVIANGGSVEKAQNAAFVAYNAEMEWYESDRSNRLTKEQGNGKYQGGNDY